MPGTPLRGRARPVRRRGHRLALLADPLEPELHRGLRLLDGAAAPRVVDPAADLLVALTARLGAQVIAGGEPGQETDTKSHVRCVPAAKSDVHTERAFATITVALPPIATRGGREPAAMGYRGKVKEQEQARALRAQNRTLADIAQTLGVSKSSVSLWVRDVPFTPTLRLRGPHRRPHPAHEAKLRQIEALNREGTDRIGVLSEEALFVAGIALYAGEGSKTDGEVRFSNSDPKMVRLFCMWFRRFFEVDETRIRGRLYLHQ